MKAVILTSSESKLSSIGHAIALIEDDKFETFAHELLGAAEILNFVPDDVDSSVVGSVQLQ